MTADLNKGYYWGSWAWKFPLPVESFVAITRLSIKHGSHYDFEQEALAESKAQREVLMNVDGFQGFFVLRRDPETPPGREEGDFWTHATFSVWRDRASYDAYGRHAPPGRGRLLSQEISISENKAGGDDGGEKEVFAHPPQSTYYEAILITEQAQEPPPPPKPPAPPPGAECDEDAQGRRLRRRELQAATVGEANAWLESWHDAISCWYDSVPMGMRIELGRCIGAFSLHLGDKLDGLMRHLGRTPPVTWRTLPVTDAVAEPHCAPLIEALNSLSIPDFPSNLPQALDTLPSMPSLIPWGVQKWHELGTPEKTIDDPTALGPTTGRSGWAALGAGAALGVASVAAGALIAIGARHRQRGTQVRLAMRNREASSK